MTKLDPIIAVKDVEASSQWYQKIYNTTKTNRALHPGMGCLTTFNYPLTGTVQKHMPTLTLHCRSGQAPTATPHTTGPVIVHSRAVANPKLI